MQTILVIEDEPALNAAIKMKLEKKGMKVVSVFKAEDAIDILENKKEHVDFIWLDILLPGMNGLEFLKHIRSNPKLKDHRVAVVSVSAGLDTQKKAEELGAVDFIVKSEHGLDEVTDRVIKQVK